MVSSRETHLKFAQPTDREFPPLVCEAIGVWALLTTHGNMHHECTVNRNNNDYCGPSTRQGHNNAGLKFIEMLSDMQ